MCVSTKLLSETQFYQSSLKLYLQARMDLDGHIFAAYVGKLISYCYISGKLEHIYPEKQQNNAEMDNGSKTHGGVDARRMNAG